MEVTIRFATLEDAALIADLSRHTFYETFAAQNNATDMDKFFAEQFTREALMAEVGAPGNTFLLAYTGDKPAGYARLHENESEDSIEIARIYAIAAAVGRGIGKALMQACLAFAHQRGKNRIWLGVWEKNERALRFYTAWGFEKVGEHDFVLGNAIQCDWILQKQL